MTKLSNKTLASFGPSVAKPTYDRSALHPGIVHFGVGNFHRVHQAIAIETCLHLPGQKDWAICGVGLASGTAASAKAQAYKDQDNLYTVTTLTSPAPRETQVVGAIAEYLHAPANPEAVLARLSDEAIRIVSLTITEGGYNIGESTGAFRLDRPEIIHDLSGGPPTTVFGYIAEALAHRRRIGLPPFTIMSCDNLPRNGDTARQAIVSFAKAADSDLADWIEKNGAFPNSMVDRIAPQVSKADRQRIVEATGVDDLIPATCEAYSSWVVEDHFCAGRPRLELAGVVFSNEVPAYVAVKGRLSNAAHMLMCYPALLMGARFVDEGMRYPHVPRLLQNFWDIDARHLVKAPSGYSTETFTNQVLERFANPAIRDQLVRVAGDGVSKIIAFHGKTILELIASGKDLRREAFLIACFGRYLKGIDDLGNAFEIFEPHLNSEDWGRLRSGDPLAVLDIEAFQGLGLRRSAAFVEACRDLSERLSSDGTGATLAHVVALDRLGQKSPART